MKINEYPILKKPQNKNQNNFGWIKPIIKNEENHIKTWIHKAFELKNLLNGNIFDTI